MDLRLRQLERTWKESQDAEDLYRYISYSLKTHSPCSPNTKKGTAIGGLPAIIHLLGPIRLLRWPPAEILEKKLDMSKWSWKEVDLYFKAQEKKSENVLPRDGILVRFFQILQNWVLYEGQRGLRCTCGGEGRGHAPNCELVEGSGDYYEDYFYTLDNWMRQGSSSLLEEYFKYGLESVAESLLNLENIVRHMNIDLGINLMVDVGFEQPNTLRLVIQNITTCDPSYYYEGSGHSITDYFTLHKTKDWVEIAITGDQCEVSWKCLPKVKPLIHGKTCDNLNHEISSWICNISQAMYDYPVWDCA